MGRILKDSLIKIDDHKIEAICNLKPLQTNRHVKVLLGAQHFHRAHITDFATMAYPLTNLFAKSQPEKKLYGREPTAGLRRIN